MLSKINQEITFSTQGSPQALGFLRIYLFGMWMIYILIDPIEDLAYLPLSISSPVGFFKMIPVSLLDTILSVGFLATFKWFTVLCLLLVTLGIFTRPLAFLACALLTFHLGLIKCFSHLQHAELPLLYAVYIISLFPISDALALQPSKHPQRAPQNYSLPIFMIVALVCIAYFEVGIYRLIHGGIAIFTEDSMKYWTVWYSYKDQDYGWNVGRYLLDYPLLALFIKLGYPLSTLVEILAPLSILSRHFKKFFVLYMVTFHIAVFITMKINFGGLSLLYIVFFDLHKWFAPESRLSKLLSYQRNISLNKA